MISTIKRIVKSNAWLFTGMKQALIYFRYLKSIGKKNTYDSLPRVAVDGCTTISSRGYHCYFGYYDKSPLNSDGKYALYLKVASNSKEGDEVDVCICDMQQGIHKSIGKTQTWNWQQGAMEQWIDEKTASFNCFDKEEKQYKTICANIETGETNIIPRAVYFYNKDFTKYLSLNFHRLDLFAKGYGYPFDVDSMDINQDGIWEVNVQGKDVKLILSLAEVMTFEEKDYMQCQHYINHVAYCPDERFIIFIHRWQVKGGEFVSRLLKFDLEEKKIMKLLDNSHVSHYCWKNDKELMIFATNEKKEKGYMVVNIENGENHLLEGLPTEDGHPTYSKDGKWVVTDTYPNNHRDQYLFLYRTEDKKLFRVDKLYSPFKYFNENRCDLHPRWSKDNQYVLVDNTSKGLRTMNIYKVKI